ncbi:enoyl-CoA hydratase-related protein [Azoarcus sp. KH32C]|uniref:enoyl-CoA hydratase-related protein n=1 Tax=Azoarcus sp. KH32C TaxID=748247 RepID=UPI00023865EB|nr:enoyl-CoA hydratase-related protein [Azoarcus sp. KH32C]BAL24170.1 enoyl-CoA hydratase [Azoarcus sp. KH32C]
MADSIAPLADDSLLLVRGPEEGVLEITLNRPQARNALSTPLLRALVALLETADADADVRCVVLTGGPRLFAAGADLAEMAAKDMQAVLLEERPRLFAAIARFPKPIVAAVCGYALGGGCELAMHADILIAGESAQFGQPEINLGIIPGAGGTQRLTRVVGKGVAMKLVLAGEFLGAREALSAGLVAEVTTDDECLPRARELALKIASKAPLAVRLAKDAVLQSFETPLATGLAMERRNFVLLAGTEDRREGIAAFLEKRTPSWQGR